MDNYGYYCEKLYTFRKNKSEYKQTLYSKTIAINF